MLHHANIDRLFALWQAIYYDEPISWRGSGFGQLGTPRTTNATPDDPLKPFQRDGGGYHTTATVTRIGDFGYTYPELEFWNKTAEELSQDAKRAVNQLYGGGQNSLQRRDRNGWPQKQQYFAQLQINRTMVPLPCEVKLYMDNQYAGSLTLLSVPSTGLSYGEIALRTADSPGAGRRYGWPVAPAEGEDDEAFFLKKLKVRVEDVRSTSISILQVSDAGFLANTPLFLVTRKTSTR